MIAPIPVTLAGRAARLVPLMPSHAPALLEAGDDPTVWRHLVAPQPTTREEMTAFIATALTEQAEGRSLPFAITGATTGAVVGTTRYLDIRLRDAGLEIGNTWLGTRWQRTAINTECKLLLLAHAFDVLGAERVQLKTDILNERSQRAIERLGATREGVLRSYQRRRDGSMRDTVMYSIVRNEWPRVRARLDSLLGDATPPVP